MSDELRQKLGQFSKAAADLAECLATLPEPPTVEASPAPRDCMTRKQVADYLQVTEQAIANWQNRADHPLPCGYAGDKPRYFLSDVKQWSIDEGKRRHAWARRAKKTNTETKVARKLSSTLTAATKRKRGSHASLQTVQGPAN